jgi:4-amino-4-deoxy-L-arabinose transferase-like glycosyltransferase
MVAVITSARSPLARGPLTAVAIAVGSLLLVTSGRYGYHRDELYFLTAGRHLAWGYPDQPPLTPLLARLMSWLAPDSLVALRLPSTLSAAAVVLLAGLIARELGARRGGQLLAAGATGLCGVVLATGHLLSTTTTSLLGWTLVTLLLVRLLRGGTSHGWLLLGATAGITMLANILAAFLLLALLVAVLLVGPREVLRSRRPWLGGLVATLLASPYLVWQARHGWPQLDVASSIASGGSGTSEPRALFLPMQALMTGPWLTPIWVVGLVALWRDARLRCLAVGYLLLCVLFIGLGGKPYYVAGLYPLLLAAGAQPVLDGVRRRWVVPALFVLSTPALAVVLPLLPVRSADLVVGLDDDAGETIGWPGYVAQIAAVYREQGPGTAVVTANYGEAGAVNRFGPTLGVPMAFSGHNGFTYWDRPPDGTTTVVAVGISSAVLGRAFTKVIPAGRLHNDEGIDNDEQGVQLFVCEGPRRPWEQLWPAFARLG